MGKKFKRDKEEDREINEENDNRSKAVGQRKLTQALETGEDWKVMEKVKEDKVRPEKLRDNGHSH